MRGWLLLGGLTLAGHQVGFAQDPVSVGDRVRLTAQAYRMESRIGTVGSVSNDRISFRPADSTESVEINYRAISMLERSVGNRPSIAQGVLYGVGAGVLGGGVVGSATCGREFGAGNNCMGSTIGVGAAIGLVGGVLLGFTLLRTDRWVRVELPGAGRSLGVQASIHF